MILARGKEVFSPVALVIFFDFVSVLRFPSHILKCTYSPANFELVALNPTMCLGPVLVGECTSMLVSKILVDRRDVGN